MNIWQNYKKVLFNTFDLQPPDTELYWEGKRDTSLVAKEWQHKYFLKVTDLKFYKTPILVTTFIISSLYFRAKLWSL